MNNGSPWPPQTRFGDARFGDARFGSQLAYDAGRLVVEGGAQGLVGDWVHCLCGVCSYCGVFNITI